MTDLTNLPATREWDENGRYRSVPQLMEEDADAMRAELLTLHEADQKQHERDAAALADLTSDLADEVIMARRLERVENGGCPCCWAVDEEVHHDGCELGEAEAQHERDVAEMEMLKGQRCEVCEHWWLAVTMVDGTKPCRLGVQVPPTNWPPPDFGCNLWTERRPT